MTELIILGTYHFSGEKDIFSSSVQKELQQFADRISKLRPTKIAVEIPIRHEEKLNRSYKSLPNEAFTKLTPWEVMDVYGHTEQFFSDNEVVQIAFRLAKLLNHQQVYAVDEDIEMSDQLASAIENQIPVEECWQKLCSIESQATNLEERFRALNSEKWSYTNHTMYMAMNKANLGNYEGTQLLLQWYERNLMIYSNLQNLAEDGDRILLLIGSGHLKLLRELVLADPRMNYLDWTELI